MSDTKKRIMIPGRPSSKIIEVYNNTDVLVNDARQIIASQLSMYRTKCSKQLTLDLKEARVVQGYLEVLIKLQREEREAARSDDLSNLSNDELLLLAQKVLSTTKAAPAEEAEDET